MKKDTLVETYPWLSKSNSVEDYISPDYYQTLLKKYSFNGKSDTKYLEAFINEAQSSRILELGCGSGRATEILLKKFPLASFVLVDLSKRMICFSRSKFSKLDIEFRNQDAVTFLSETEKQFDLVCSLWSFSHSIHQHIHSIGFDNASSLLKCTLTKFIDENLETGGRFFLIHFDSMSEEQKILMRQWKRVFPEFSDLYQQSPSKRILDSVLWDLDNRGQIVLSVNHLQGDAISYSNETEVLETFFNFHMETYFNGSPLLKSVMHDVTNQISQYRKSDGSYAIRTGCYIYSFEKV